MVSSNGSRGRTLCLPPTTAEPIKKSERVALVVDSDEERESFKRAEMVDVESEEDSGPLVIVDDETASGAGRAAKGGRLAALDNSNDEDVNVNWSDVITDRGVANGDAVLNGALRDVIYLFDENYLSTASEAAEPHHDATDPAKVLSCFLRRYRVRTQW
ncbi:hypothetical protein MRX96_023373 [Rhipicephalus microplus]